MLYADGKRPEAERLAPFFLWEHADHERMSAAREPSVHLLPLGSLKTILDLLVWLIGFFVIDLFAARQTGRVRTGALIGLVAGLIGSLIAVIFVIVQIATNGKSSRRHSITMRTRR